MEFSLPTMRRKPDSESAQPIPLTGQRVKRRSGRQRIGCGRRDRTRTRSEPVHGEFL